MFKILYINPELEPSIQASIRKRYQDYLTDNPLLAIVEVSNVEAPKIVNETTEGERLVIPPSLLDSVMEEVLYAIIAKNIAKNTFTIFGGKNREVKLAPMITPGIAPISKFLKIFLLKYFAFIWW